LTLHLAEELGVDSDILNLPEFDPDAKPMLGFILIAGGLARDVSDASDTIDWNVWLERQQKL
jgi:hypothetical protein